MAKYFKGKIVLTKELNDYEKWYLIATYGRYGNYNIEYFNNDFIEHDIKDVVQLYFNGKSNYDYQIDKFYICEDEKLIESVKSLYHKNIVDKYSNLKSQTTKDVIFELITDKNGFLYAKEVFTNRIFPLFNVIKENGNSFATNVNFTYKIQKVSPKGLIANFLLHCFYELNYPNMLQVNSVVILTEYVNQNVVSDYIDDLEKPNILDSKLIPSEEKVEEKEISEKHFKFYQIISKIKYKKKKQKIKKLKEHIAWQEEKEKKKVENQIQEKRNYIERIHELADMNAFNEDFEFINTQNRERLQESILFTDRESKNVELIIMDKIELSLAKLKQIDEELYQSYLKEYHDLIDNKNLTKFDLTSLLERIDLNFIIGNLKCENILEILDKLKVECIENIYNNNDDNSNNLTFLNLNKVHKFILMNRTKYELLSLRKIIKDISFLYIMTIYNQKITITLKELENSYFADNLETVVLVLRAMKEANIIENNQLLNLDYISCSSVFEMIKSIEFKGYLNENDKEFIKTLS